MLSSRMVKEGDGTKLRDLLYLDLGLEAQLRLMAERSLGNPLLPKVNRGSTFALRRPTLGFCLGEQRSSLFEG